MAVDPMTIAALAAAGSSIGGALLGADSARKSRRQAERMAREAYALLAGLEQPAFQDELYQYSPEMFEKLVGEVKPVLEDAVEMGPSAMANVMDNIDPRLRETEMATLAKLSGIADEGLNEEQKLELENAKRAVRSEAEAQKQTMLQDAQQRGIADAGFTRMAQMKAGQAAADRAAMEGMRQAAIGAQSQQQAIEAAGALAGNIGQRRFAEQSAIAQAKDVADRFKAQNLQAVRARNIAAQNQAQQQNLAAKQRIEAQRAELKRREMERRKNLVGTRYDREFAKRQAQAAALTGQSQQMMQHSAAQGQFGADVGATIGSTIAKIYGSEAKE